MVRLWRVGMFRNLNIGAHGRSFFLLRKSIWRVDIWFIWTLVDHLLDMYTHLWSWDDLYMHDVDVNTVR